MQEVFDLIPDQRMTPAEAFLHVVKKKVEYVELNKIMGRTPAVMIVPYPPGIPIMMGGEIMNERSKSIYNYLLLRQEFENEFPGYESDIHGVERIDGPKGKKFVQIYCIKK